MNENKMRTEIERIIKESACNEEVWVTVDEMFDDAGINILLEMNYPRED